MSTDLSYVISLPSKIHLKLRLNIDENSEEEMTFNDNFIILKYKLHTRILYVEPKIGIVSAIHFKLENEKQKLLGMFTSPNHTRKGYMSHLLSYAKSIEPSFWLSNDFTSDGDAFIAQNGTNIKPYKKLSEDDSDLFIQISKIFFDLNNSLIPHGQATKARINSVKELHKMLNEQLIKLQEQLLY